MSLSNACQHLMEKEGDILSIILSGSRARGDFKEGSDYDFLFVTKSGVEDPLEEHEIKKNYANQIAKRAIINEDLIQIYLWPLENFKKEHKRGNSFVYCALRDGKVISSRYNLDLKQPKNCQKAAMDRIDFAKRNINVIGFFLKNVKKGMVGYPELEYLGYCSMHICWAACMFNNFCPVSKYTVLRESKKYFTEQEFKSIKKAYNFYEDQNYRRTRKKNFVTLFNDLKKIIKKVEDKYAAKQT